MIASPAVQSAHKTLIEGVIGLCANWSCALFAPMPRIGDPWCTWGDTILRKIFLLNGRSPPASAPTARLAPVVKVFSRTVALPSSQELFNSLCHSVDRRGHSCAEGNGRLGMGDHCQAAISVVMVVAVRGGW